MPTRVRLWKPFKPHPLVRGGHLQTLAAYWAAASSVAITRKTRHVIELPDGDALTVHDDQPAGNWVPGSPIVLLIHGMLGSAESPQIVRMASKLRSRGVRTFRMNMRGCGDGHELATRPYHAGRSADLEQVVQTLHELCPRSPIYVAGFSLGANIVLKWLGEFAQQGGSLVTRAMAVSPPVCLGTCTELIQTAAMGVYDRYFAKQLYQHVRRWTPQDLVVQSESPRRILDFDEAYTAPRSGFDSASHYYQESSSARFIAQIETPTLIISAQDDPVIPVAMLRQVDLADAVTLHLPKSGGHLGFLARRNGDPDRWWLDWRVADWLLDAHAPAA